MWAIHLFSFHQNLLQRESSTRRVDEGAAGWDDRLISKSDTCVVSK
jgi:hypothetical protein